MSDAEPGPQETQEMPAPLDFSGALLIAHPRPSEEPVAAPEDVLVAHSFGDQALLLPSDGVARRILLETIRNRHRIAGRPKRRRLLACMGGAPLSSQFAADADVEDLPDEIGAVRAAIGPQTAAIFVAPWRLSAALETLSGAFLAELREAADEYGLALVFDETDAGLGRTGMAFAHEWTGVTPDLMLVGRGAGLPVSCLVLTEKFARALPQERPPVGEEERARAGDMLAALFAEGFEGPLQNLGWSLEDGLARLRYSRADLFGGLLGTGLIQGLLCTGPAAPLAERLGQAGLLVRAVGDVLCMLPPLDVAAEEIADAVARLEAVVAEMEQAPA